jgi:hypothetical protein
VIAGRLLASAAETRDLITRLKVPGEHPFEKLYLGFSAHAGDGMDFAPVRY